ncbi:MAG: hypothetical protein FJY77_04440 [Candidatus Altiarchaeales archaeon]|nr:hypothetical protein [Candidatus Altiarchaeales archaeon]
MKCCKECPEYDVCDDRKKCCDMCDFYNPKTKKCAYIKKKKKSEKDMIGRKKILEDEDVEEDLEPLEEDENINDPEDEYSDKDPFEEEDINDFFDT